MSSLNIDNYVIDTPLYDILTALKKELTNGKEIVKVIVVPKKLVNIVVKG